MTYYLLFVIPHIYSVHPTLLNEFFENTTYAYA